MATSKILHLTRHAEAEHNVAEDYSILDAPLTALGRSQSQALHQATKDNIQKSAELLVSSPLRRPMQTFLLGYPDLKARLEKEGQPVILLTRLQEVNDFPCDTGSDPANLKADPEFVSLDFSDVEEGWNSKKGNYAPVNAAKRAQWVRRWLRERPEKEIVVVAHGDILRYVTDGQNSTKPWSNAEVRKYTFASDSDEEALLVPLGTEAQIGEKEPTSSSHKFQQ